MNDHIYSYLHTQGVAETKLSEAADGISRTLQQIADPRMEVLYEEPPQELCNSCDALTTQAAAKNKTTPRGRTMESQWRADSAKGLAGDYDALGRALEAKDRASSILHHLVEPGMPNWGVRGFKIQSPKDVAALLLPIRSPYFESLKVAVLDKHMVIQHSEVVSVGSLNESIAHPREIMRVLTRLGTPGKFNSIVLAHNHPSGDPSPSEADRRITNKLQAICSELGYSVLDHVITNGNRFFSFRESGILPYDAKGGRAKGVGKMPVTQAPEYTPDILAPWEVVARDALMRVDNPDVIRDVVDSLRSAPTHGHILYLSTRNTLLGVQRVPHIMTMPQQKLRHLLFSGAQREGAYAFVLDCGHAKAGVDFLSTVNGLRQFSKSIQVNFLDAFDWDAKSPSAQERGLLAESPSVSEGGTGSVLEGVLQSIPGQSRPIGSTPVARSI